MEKKRLRTRAHGQSLVEYALVLVLVAVVAIVVIGLAGRAIQRVMGIAAGALGAKYDTKGAVEITTAECLVIHYPITGYPNGGTGINLVGLTDQPLDSLTYSSNLSYGTGVNGGNMQFDSNGSGGFILNRALAMYPDRGLCPNSIVIQSASGAIAVSPVTIEERLTPPPPAP